MSEARQNHPHDDAGQTDEAGQDGYAELRRLLLGPEQAQLSRLRQWLESPEGYAREVSRVLPEAVELRTAEDQRLSEALLPTVETGLADSVRKRPQLWIDALFPVIGPAIRKAIAETLSVMIQSLNQTLEHSLSLRSLGWRAQAWRTGKPFAEVVLLNTLVYRAEQVFLFHRETGLALQQVVAEKVEAWDASLVSSMYTALQDFMRDALHKPESETLDRPKMGEHTLWVEQGPYALIAVAIRGAAPEGFRVTLQEALEEIHRAQGEALAAFAGDAGPFAACRPRLEACLQSQFQPPPRRTLFALRVAAGLILGALALWIVVALRQEGRWQDYLARLRAEPGLVVTRAEKGWRQYYLEGLRDPLAADPAALLAASRLDPGHIVSRWEPYQALAPDFVLARARALLEPPATVTLELRDGALIAAGTAPRQWIAEARRLARAVPGVMRFDTDALLPEELVALRELKEGIERQVIRFVLDTAQLAPGQAAVLEQVAADARALERRAAEADRQPRIEVVGHADQSGAEAKNQRLSEERAESVRRFLASRGVAPAALAAAGVGAREPLRPGTSEEELQLNRSVTFRVGLSDAPAKKAAPPQ